jgi:hypothetical protein
MLLNPLGVGPGLWMEAKPLRADSVGSSQTRVNAVASELGTFSQHHLIRPVANGVSRNPSIRCRQKKL